MKRHTMNVKAIFVAAALAVCLFLPTTTSAQIVIDGRQISGMSYTNNHGNSITDATVKGSMRQLFNSGDITNATVDNSGMLANDRDGTITNATLNASSMFGTLFNYGMITNATLNGSSMGSGGLCYNYGTVTNATLNGGRINNGGRIEEMTYVGGTYYSRQFTDPFGDTYADGTIGTLILAGNSTKADKSDRIDWGNVENILFYEQGQGVLSLTAVIENPIAAMGMSMAFDGFQAASAGLPGISFVGLIAQNVDFTNGNIVIDFTDLVGFSEKDVLSSLFAGGFSLATHLGATEIKGLDSLISFELAFETGSLFVLNDGVLASGWSFSDEKGFVYGEVPEPATLLMLGLGLAGLPVVRRLCKR